MDNFRAQGWHRHLRGVDGDAPVGEVRSRSFHFLGRGGQRYAGGALHPEVDNQLLFAKDDADGVGLEVRNVVDDRAVLDQENAVVIRELETADAQPVAGRAQLGFFQAVEDSELRGVRTDIRGLGCGNWSRLVRLGPKIV